MLGVDIRNLWGAIKHKYVPHHWSIITILVHFLCSELPKNCGYFLSWETWSPGYGKHDKHWVTSIFGCRFLECSIHRAILNCIWRIPGKQPHRAMVPYVLLDSIHTQHVWVHQCHHQLRTTTNCNIQHMQMKPILKRDPPSTFSSIHKICHKEQLVAHKMDIW